MPFIPKVLSRETTFTRPHSNDKITLEIGEPYLYERSETPTHIIHTAKITRNGYTWFNVKTTPKDVSAIPTNGNGTLKQLPEGSAVQQVTTQDNGTGPHTPINLQSSGQQTALQATAKDAANAVVRIAQREGLPLATGTEMEYRARRLARIADILSGEVYQVNYYIPESLKKVVGTKHLSVFRRHGFRFDGSNWVFSAKGLEAREVKEIFAEWDRIKPVESDSGIQGFMNREELGYWKIQYTKEQLATMRDRVLSTLYNTLIKCHTSLIERMDAASEALKEATDKLDDNASANAMSQIQKDYCTRLKATLKDTCERFEMCIRGAEIFDNTGSLDSLFEAIRIAIHTNAVTTNILLARNSMSQVKVPKTIA